ncbi:MAG: CPBP family intramembrane metalloprotease [Candidatus Wallbacteria bacterium]|nr:CPBP family intramembrane metalloprotease [Candidatus Wallbacteria bacterium]
MGRADGGRDEDSISGSPEDLPGAPPVLGALALFACTLAAGALIQSAAAASLLGGHGTVVFAALWLYAPIAALQLAGRDLAAHGFTLRQRPGSARLFALCLLLLVPYTPLVAIWLPLVQGRAFHPAIPPDFAALLLHQLLVVALPEEAFFRGYLQSRFNEGRKPWRLFGLELGPGLVASSALFALAHLVLRRDPRTLGVFFPGLVFGYLRQQTGSIALPVVYHAVCNLYLFIAAAG